MTATEQRLREALTDPGWALQPPGDPAAWVRGRVARDRRRRTVLLPTGTAVVVAATLLAISGLDPRGQSRPPTVATVVATVPYEEPSRVPVDESEAAPPPDRTRPRFAGPAALPACRAGEATATLALSGSRGELVLRRRQPRSQPCGLPGTAPVLVAVSGGAETPLDTAYPQQPSVPNPPVRPDGVLWQQGLHGDLEWESFCGDRSAAFELRGLAAAPIPVAIGGELPPCRDGARVSLTRLHIGTAARAIVPVDRQRLRVTLDLPPEATPTSLRRFTVRIGNPTRTPVSLRPCPSYLLELENPDPPGSYGGSSSAQSAPLPCAKLPARLGPGQEVTIEQQARFGETHPSLRGDQVVRVRWGIAGTEPFEGSVAVRYGAPRAPVAVVPWRQTPAPPGEPQKMPLVGQPLPFAPLTPSFEGLPTQVRRGELVRYGIRLTNTATAGAVELRPCPGFVQHLQSGGREVVDEHYLNCDAAPLSIEHGTAILLQMELTVPTDLPAGDALLTWKIGKLDLAGSPSAFHQLRVIA